jgi:hypothetical protein
VHGGIVENGNFECNMYITEKEPVEFESANSKQYPRIGNFVNPTTRGSKTS